MQVCITVIRRFPLVMQVCITVIRRFPPVMQACITVIRRFPLVMQACITVIRRFLPVMQVCITVIQRFPPVMQAYITAHPFAGHFSPPSFPHFFLKTVPVRGSPSAGQDRGHTGRVAGQTVRPGTAVISVGDYNDFWFSKTIGIFKRAGMKNAIEALPENNRYTYVYDGHSQTLDNILVSDSVHIDMAEVLHVNAELPEKERLSDHDPVLVQVHW